jgi:hypothetical protein
MSIYRGVGSGITSDALTAYLSVLADIIAAQAAAEAAQAAAEAAQAAAELAETNAETAEVAAELAETNAEAAEINAAADASLAQEWATNAEDLAVTGYPGFYSALHHSAKASAQRVLAETAETNAAASELAAGTSETNAALSEVAAEAARDLAQDYAGDALSYLTSTSDLYDQFDDRYLGSKAANPTLDNDGDALIDGALYWNTTSNELRVYDLGNTTWVSFPSGFVLKSGDTMTGPLTMAAGTAALPSFSFTADPNTGIYSIAGDSLGISTGGTLRANFGTGGTAFVGSLYLDAGTVAVPAVTWNGDLDTGFYLPGAGSLGVAVGAANVGTFSATGLDTPMVVTDSAMSHRNKIINGRFDFWQRGSANKATGGYYADRWVVGGSLSTWSFDRGAFSPGDQLKSNPVYALLGNVTVAAADAASYVHFYQKIENVRTFSGKRITVSFSAKSTVAGKKIAVNLEQHFGTGGSPSATVQGTGQQLTLTTSYAEYSLTFDVASIAGKTIGSDNNDSLILVIWIDAGTSYSARTGGTLDKLAATVSVTEIQVEEGSVATPFEVRPMQGELALCQRYYEVVNYAAFYFPGVAAATAIYFPVTFKVTKRAVPVLTLPSSTDACYNSVGSSVTPTSWSGTATVDGVRMEAVHASGLGGLVNNTLTADSEL